MWDVYFSFLGCLASPRKRRGESVEVIRAITRGGNRTLVHSLSLSPIHTHKHTLPFGYLSSHTDTGYTVSAKAQNVFFTGKLNSISSSKIPWCPNLKTAHLTPFWVMVCNDEALQITWGQYQ